MTIHNTLMRYKIQKITIQCVFFIYNNTYLKLYLGKSQDYPQFFWFIKSVFKKIYFFRTLPICIVQTYCMCLLEREIQGIKIWVLITVKLTLGWQILHKALTPIPRLSVRPGPIFSHGQKAMCANIVCW